MADLGHGKNIALPKNTVVSTGKTLSYQTHPTFTVDEEIVDKKFVDDSNDWARVGSNLSPASPGDSVTADGGLTVGTGAVGVDPTITMVGEDSTGEIKWMEDEAELRVGDTTDYLSVAAGPASTVIAATSDIDIQRSTQISSGTLSLNSGSSVTEFSIDGTLAGDSDAAIPTEKAVKLYGDTNFRRKEANTLIVAKTGGEFSTVTTALAAAIAGDMIRVFPGSYTESAMAVPAGVTILGTAQQRVTIVASDILNPLFTVSNGNVEIGNLTLDGVTNSSCILDNSAINTNRYNHLTFKNSLEGIKCSGIDTIFRADDIFCESTVTRGIYTIGTGDSVVVMHGVDSNATTSLQADSGEMLVNTVIINGGTNGLYANGGTIGFHVADVQNVTNVIRVNNSGKVEGGALQVRTGSTLDILQEDATSEVQFTSSQIDSNKVSVVDISKILIDFNDQLEGDEGVTFMKEVHVGTPEMGYESVFGGGDSYTRGMIAYTENTSNVFVDISIAVRSFSGSTFTFPGTAANNRIYLASTLTDGSDFLQFFGIKAAIQTAAVVGAGEIVTEYWNGAAWIEFNHMSTDSVPPFFPYAKAIFERTGSNQVRYNSLILSSWAKNDPITPALGTTYYWMRFTIKTAITTAPIFEQFKLHTHRMESNADGWTEFFGDARPIGIISWDYNNFQPFGNSPSNQDLFVLNSGAGDQADLGVGRIENSFPNNAITRNGLCVLSPLDLDTSNPLRLRISFVPRGTGDVEWMLNFGITRTGDTVSINEAGAPAVITAEQHLSTIVTVTTADIQHYAEIDIDVSETVSRRSSEEPDLLWISLARDATVGNLNDTIAAAVDIIQISPGYAKWSLGSHFL